MDIKLPLIYVHWVDTIGSLSVMVLAIWIIFQASKLRHRGYIHQYLFLLSCSLAIFAVSRALGHILKNYLLYTGPSDAWSNISPISGGVNTIIFIIIASLSFYYGIFRNMQETRDREKEMHMKEIQDTRDFLQKVIDSLNTQLVVIDQNYRIVMVNEKFIHDSMLSKQEILGSSCYETLNRFCETVENCGSENTEEHLCSWNAVRSTGQPNIVNHIHRYPGTKGPWHMEISASPVFGKDGTAEYIIETLTDVTDKVKMEEMQRTQEKLSGVVELASAVAHELNTPMFTVLGNAQLLKRSIKPDAQIEKNVDAIIRNVKKMSRLTGQMAHITDYMTKDYVNGEKIVDIMTSSKFSKEEGEQEQKDRVEREERWLRLERLAAMGQLTASVAHELNNALNIVLGYSQLLLRESIEGSRTHNDLKKIEKNAKQGQRIVAGLLDYTRSMTREKAYQDVNRHLEDVLRLMEHRMSLDGISIVRQFSSDLDPVMMDADEMKQVYLNLLNNAAQAIGERGEVTVSTEFDKTRKQVVISISDTGPGLTSEVMDQMFTPFYTTKPEGTGTGLGLNVSRDIVHNHGGALECKNRPEGGAVFIIRLPLDREITGSPEE